MKTTNQIGLTPGVTAKRQGFWKKHLDKLGMAGAIVTVLCCLGAPAIVSVVTAIGAGFLVNDSFLLPLLVVFLLVALWGLILGARRQHHWLPVIIGAVSAVVMFLALAVASSRPLIWVGIAGLITASVLNIWLGVRRPQRHA